MSDSEHDETGDTSDDEEEEEEEVELVGNLGDPPSRDERKLLTRSNFPSKVGGKPAWLVPQSLPDTKCKACGRPMRFLMQVHASRGDDKPGAYLRALHVFVCTSCQPNAVRVFRAQLPRENAFYSPEYPDEDAVRALAANDEALDPLVCWDCGLPIGGAVDGDVGNRCAECSRLIRLGDALAVFEERELKVSSADAPSEEDEDEQGDASDEGEVEDASKLAADADAMLAAAQSTATADGDAAIMEKLQEYRERVAKDPENALDSSEQKAFEDWSKDRGEKDPVFSQFMRWSRENPGHVLRYAFAGEPLWFCTKGRMKRNPPACPLCGAARAFEFQVQPQLISLLSSSPLAKRLDYGAVYVYACSGHCEAAADNPYMEEYVYVQPEPGDAWLPSES